MGPLSRDAVTELLSMTATLIEERRRLRTILGRLPTDFGKVREQLNELARTLR